MQRQPHSVNPLLNAVYSLLPLQRPSVLLLNCTTVALLCLSLRSTCRHVRWPRGLALVIAALPLPSLVRTYFANLTVSLFQFCNTTALQNKSCGFAVIIKTGIIWGGGAHAPRTPIHRTHMICASQFLDACFLIPQSHAQNFSLSIAIFSHYFL